MNRIARVTLMGFKSIAALDLELRDLNVLIGGNGAGKSNLIGFFRMLNFLQSGSLQLYVARQGGASSLLHYGPKRTPQISADIQFETDKGINHYQMRLVHAARDTLIFADEEIAYSQKDRPTSGPSISLGAGHKESGLKEYCNGGGAGARTAGVIWRMMGDWQVFQFHDTSHTADVKQYKNIADNLYLRADGGNLAPFLYKMSQEESEYYARIVDTIRMCAPFFREFSLVPNNKGSIMLNWTEEGSDMIFGPHQLSDGTLRLMSLVTLLLQPHPPSMIIVDEPELGLHPYALKVVGSLIKGASKSSQILVTTQSVGLIDEFDLEDLITVDRENGGSVFRRHTADTVRGWLEDYSLSELWEKNVLGGRPT